MLVSKSNIASASNKTMTAAGYIGSGVGAIAGFMASDTIGLSGLINTIWSTTGVESVVPALANIQPVVVPLLAAGIYIAIGLAVGKISFDGKAARIVINFASWFFIGSGAREAMSGLISGVRAIKSAGQ